MGNRLNKLNILLLLMSNTALSITNDNNVLNHEETINRPSEIKLIKRSSSKSVSVPIILYDSIVVLDRKGRFSNISGSKKIGSFVYELNPGNLKNKISGNQYQSASQSVSDTGYRLVQIPGKNFLLSDGSFIIKFKDPADKAQVTSYYNLNPRYEMPDATSYISKDFSGLEALIKRIKADPRVLLVELDLIDPYIQEQ